MVQKKQDAKVINFPTKGNAPKPDDPEIKKAMQEAYKRGRIEELEQLGASDMAEEKIRTPKALGQRTKNTEEVAAYYKGVVKQAFEMGSNAAMIYMGDVTNLPHEEREKYAEKLRGELTPPKIKIVRLKDEVVNIDAKKIQELVDRSFKEGIEHGIEGFLMVAKRIDEQPKIIEQLKKEGKLKLL